MPKFSNVLEVIQDLLLLVNFRAWGLWHHTHIVGFQREHFMERRKLHATPQAGNVEERIESSCNFRVVEKAFQVALPATSETRPPPGLKAIVTLEMIVTDFSIDLAIRRDSFVDVLLDEVLLDIGR